MSTTSTTSTISPCFKGCFECGKTGKKNFDGRDWKQRFEKEESVKCKECVKTEQQYQARTVCLLEDENIISLILSILVGIQIGCEEEIMAKENDKTFSSGSLYFLRNFCKVNPIEKIKFFKYFSTGIFVIYLLGLIYISN